MNKKAQLDYPIIAFVVVVFGLLIVAPIVLKIFLQVRGTMSSQLGNITNGGDVAQKNFNKVMDTGINFWDQVVIAGFIFSIILLFISAFMIDAHPVWIILYIFLSFLLVLFAPSMVGALDSLYSPTGAYSAEVARMPVLLNLQTNFGYYLVGIMVITGIIIYGKIAWSKPKGVRR